MKIQVTQPVRAIRRRGFMQGAAAVGAATLAMPNIVAAQGKGDLDALRAALLSPAAYVAMVASSRKARTLLDRLRAEGIDEALLARLKSPAGLDLGGIDPEEIAVSVIAEIVQTRNRRAHLTAASSSKGSG